MNESNLDIRNYVFATAAGVGEGIGINVDVASDELDLTIWVEAKRGSETMGVFTSLDCCMLVLGVLTVKIKFR